MINRLTDGNCTGIWIVHLIVVYLDVSICCHPESGTCLRIISSQTWRCWGWGAERSWGCLDQHHWFCFSMFPFNVKATQILGKDTQRCGYIYVHKTSVSLEVPLEVYLVKKKRPEREILKFRHGFGWMESRLWDVEKFWVRTCRVWFGLWCVMWVLLNLYFRCKYQSSVSKKYSRRAMILAGILKLKKSDSPAFQKSFLLLMAFAQQLGQKALAANVACRDQWVNEVQQSFMEKCEAAATEGRCKAWLEVGRPSMMHDSALQLLDDWFGKQGFTSYLAEYCTRDRKVHLRAEWSMAKELPEQPATHPQGMKGHCPICHENRHLVALMPCGHSVCKKCHQGGQLRQCPMCRTNLTGATRALFVEWVAYTFRQRPTEMENMWQMNPVLHAFHLQVWLMRPRLVMGHEHFGSLKGELGLVLAGLYPFPAVSQVWEGSILWRWQDMYVTPWAFHKQMPSALSHPLYC